MNRLFPAAVPYNPFFVLVLASVLANSKPLAVSGGYPNPRFRKKRERLVQPLTVRPGRRRAFNRMM